MQRNTLRGRWPLLWAWLLACMVLAQGLGLVHGIAHGTQGNAALHGGTPQHFVQAAGETPGWLGHLFPAHQATSDCRLYDQSSHGDCVPGVPAVALPGLALPGLVQVFEAPSPPAATPLVQARAPPSVLR